MLCRQARWHARRPEQDLLPGRRCHAFCRLRNPACLCCLCCLQGAGEVAQGFTDVGRGVAEARCHSAADCFAAAIFDCPVLQASGPANSTKSSIFVQVGVVAKDAVVDAVSGALGKAGEVAAWG